MRKISYIVSALLLCPTLGSAQDIIKSVHGFADVNFDVIEGPGSDSRFKLGEYDTYVTGTLDERTSYLSEITFEHEGADGWEVALERFWVRYEFNQLLSASAGKFHTAVGYWNRTYHHGSFLFASIDKPVSRSLFPIHTTGLLLSGKQTSGARISYDLMIGNGTGASPKSDNDDGKSVNLHLRSRAIDDVDLGLSVYRENVSQGAARGEMSLQAGAATEDLTLLILSPSIAVRRGDLMIEAEFVLAGSDDDTSGNNSSAKAVAALAAYDSGLWTPFVKFDYLKVDADDIFFKASDKKVYSVGFGYHFSDLAVAKLQLRHNSPAGSSSNDLLTQVAIAF
jgi:hypothetical protein